jgi:predicted metal-dependent enzyme (double-stranded beta helix superfamily)
MSRAVSNTVLSDLIRRLDHAVSASDTESICLAVKNTLIEVVGSREEFLEPQFLRPCAERYARRLLHRDPAGRYTVVVMVWGRGQATPIHDHAGIWCVECVYRGKIQVTSYNILGNCEAPTFNFATEKVVRAGVGEAGALIPPFEYHMIENPTSEPAITLHVYGGEMTWSNAYTPTGDGFRRERRQLSYTD